MGNSGRGRERELGLVYTIQMAPADNGALRRGITSGERKGRHCWRFHCHAWQSVRRRNLQINYILRLTRKLRLGLPLPHKSFWPFVTGWPPWFRPSDILPPCPIAGSFPSKDILFLEEDRNPWPGTLRVGRPT